MLFNSLPFKSTLKIFLNCSHEPHNISVNDRSHIRWWSHKIMELKNSFCLMSYRNPFLRADAAVNKSALPVVEKYSMYNHVQYMIFDNKQLCTGLYISYALLFIFVLECILSIKKVCCKTLCQIMLASASYTSYLLCSLIVSLSCA